MSKYWMGLALAGFVAMGCGDKDGDTGDTAEADADTDSDTDADPEFDVTWGASSIDFTVTGLDSGQIGIAETNAACESAEYGCWTGEDCIYGYVSPDGSVELGPYCHPFSGGSLSLADGSADCTVTEGSSTCFATPDYEGLVTYYAENATGDCWVWGSDVGYYSGLGCTNL